MACGCGGAAMTCGCGCTTAMTCGCGGAAIAIGCSTTVAPMIIGADATGGRHRRRRSAVASERRHIHDHLPARHGALRAHDLHLARGREDREGHARPDAGRHRHLHLLHHWRRSRFRTASRESQLEPPNNFASAPTPSAAAAVAAAAAAVAAARADDEEARDPRRARMALDHGPTRAARHHLSPGQLLEPAVHARRWRSRRASSLSRRGCPMPRRSSGSPPTSWRRPTRCPSRSRRRWRHCCRTARRRRRGSGGADPAAGVLEQRRDDASAPRRPARRRVARRRAASRLARLRHATARVAHGRHTRAWDRRARRRGRRDVTPVAAEAFTSPSCSRCSSAAYTDGDVEGVVSGSTTPPTASRAASACAPTSSRGSRSTGWRAAS